ncbi:MAG: ATP-binding cassette domain-containing protein [Saprospiraceae bacterium]|nr:ATP-binding cassette domain-containing protein [Saprospiraceae bacterium]
MKNGESSSHTIVKLEGVSVFQDNRAVLENINLTLSHGEFAYLIGKTGSGKSSLLKTLYAALPLLKGRGEVAGFDLATLNRKTIPFLRRDLGIIFQDFNLLDDRTVYGNLLFALEASGWKDRKKMDERIKEVLSQVDLVKEAQKKPQLLSGGEQQRVVIARALLNNPKIIIADEPTGNLDPETSDDILLRLRYLSQQNNTAVILATHDYRILQNFPARIIRCQDGRVLDDKEIEL